MADRPHTLCGDSAVERGVQAVVAHAAATARRLRPVLPLSLQLALDDRPRDDALAAVAGMLHVAEPDAPPRLALARRYSCWPGIPPLRCGPWSAWECAPIPPPTPTAERRSGISSWS